jgi:hypothetical protein
LEGMTIVDRPGTPAFGLRYAPDYPTDAEKCAWSGGYWAHSRHRSRNPFSKSDPRYEAWEDGFYARERKVLYA